MKKILIFTDSRGQHKPTGTNHEVFPNRLKNEVKNLQVDLLLCPMKWTTTLDFLEYISNVDTSDYDWIILYTGIVEWSPRPQKSAINDLYNNKNTNNEGKWFSNTRDYSKKIVNNKSKVFNRLFGEKEIKGYLSNAFDIEYEGQQTINMYSLDMARIIAYKLKTIDNLIFINSNRVLSNWEGDFKRERPKNMNITHKYSDLFSEVLGEDKVVDLRIWNEKDIKTYTCDNMHLTESGNNWIFEKLIEKIGVDLKNKWEVTKGIQQQKFTPSVNDLVDFKPIEKFRSQKKVAFLESYNTKFLATLIIGVRLVDRDITRIKNLEFLLSWIDFYYEDLFDVLIVEQDSESRLEPKTYSKYRNARYEFLYNPEDYNRGWGYNVAVKHYCKESKVVALMDTDVLPGASFVSDVRDCFIGRFDLISPYQNIYYTDEEEVINIKSTNSLTNLKDQSKIKNPVTLTGGVVIFDRKTFLELKGFEQYIGYGCEDRALDVMALSLCEPSRIKITPVAYVHLYHPNDKVARKNFDEIYDHLKKNYKCEWSPKLKKTDFIHLHCEHVSDEELVSLLIKKSKNFGDIDLYKSDDPILINGRTKDNKQILKDIILPPLYKDAKHYINREVYVAPKPDSEEIEQFRNAFLGERCFIIGNGPSLNEHDLSLLENEYSFGVNSFFYKTRESGFRPTFYVVEDTSVMNENIDEIRDYHAPFKFFPTLYKSIHPNTPNAFFFNMNRGFYEKSSPNYCIPRFSTDATKELYCGQSVTYINLQLAYFMGFTEIYLIGMDFSYIIPASHKRTGDIILSDTDDPNHFHKDYFGKGKTWKDPKLERVGMNYRMAKLVYESVGRKVFNATIGGSLEIFDRVDYSSLFDSTQRKSYEKSIFSFNEANKLYASKRYSDALVIYINLAETANDFNIYLRAALDCYCLAKNHNQPVQSELFNRLQKLMN